MVASAVPLVSIGGRLSFGWLGDRLDKRWLTAAGLALTSLGLLFFGYAAGGDMWLHVPFLIFFSTGWGGGVTLRFALLRQYFGRRRFGTIHGFVVGIMMLGHMAGPPLAGWAFDTWGSYQGIWFAFAGLAAAAVVVMVTTPSVGNTIQSSK